MERESGATAGPSAVRSNNARTPRNQLARGGNASASRDSCLREPSPPPVSAVEAYEFNESEDVEMNLEQNDYNGPQPGIPAAVSVSQNGSLDEQLPDPGSLDDLAQQEDLNEEDQEDPSQAYSHIEDVRMAQEFIAALQHADINNGDLSSESVDRLMNPPEYPLELDEEVDADLIECLRIFLHGHNSAKHYNRTIKDLKMRHPEDELLSFNQLKRTIRELTGIVPIIHDMCPNSCLAYTGPLSNRQTCHRCGESRIDPTTGEPRLQLYTIPLGFSIQAMKRHVRTAQQMEYFWTRSQELMKELRENQEIELIDDIVCGTDVLFAVDRGDIQEDDTVLMFSFDGAQIYRNKLSDCWISIWTVVAFSPDLRFKRRLVLPGSITPGPKKIKIVESCLFPSLHHIAAINKLGGLPVWNAQKKTLKKSKLYTVAATADGPGMVYLNGLVGHSGKIGCRLWCGLIGRHKPGASMYYPMLSKPDNYTVAGCDHADVPPHIVKAIDPIKYQRHLQQVLNARTQAEYEYLRRETGICKPSIFSGLPNGTYLGIPNMFPVDIMHLVLNLADLLMGLWRGKIECSKTSDKIENWPWVVLVGNTWLIHGQDVVGATPYLPGSFDRPPRNPAEKINSGYKAWEFLLYIFALGPGLFYGVLPDLFWKSYCKLVAGVRIIYQRRIHRNDLCLAHRLLIEFVSEFESIYVDRRCDRMHFVRPIVHLLVHLALEAVRLGPGITSSQWTMERNIGSLISEIKQDSTPYANLSCRAVERAEVICLKALFPAIDGEVENEEKLPAYSQPLGDGYVLLRAMDTCAREMLEEESNALKIFLEEDPRFGAENIPTRWKPSVVRWSRLLLPCGQVARSLWKESMKPLNKVRIARRVKLRYKNNIEFGEVRYYFRLNLTDSDVRTLAVVSLYTRPDPHLLEISAGTLWSCRHQGDNAIVVVNVKMIESVVAVIPHSTGILGAEWKDRVFVVEKPGLDISIMAGVIEDLIDEDN
ncbi:hypothetical protein H0H93_001990 [Arthromyces matolae]|nr:hypothetical protein H0H93_001990 [Arthromyces matolae]